MEISADQSMLAQDCVPHKNREKAASNGAVRYLSGECRSGEGIQEIKPLDRYKVTLDNQAGVKLNQHNGEVDPLSVEFEKLLAACSSGYVLSDVKKDRSNSLPFVACEGDINGLRPDSPMFADNVSAVDVFNECDAYNSEGIRRSLSSPESSSVSSKAEEKSEKCQKSIVIPFFHKKNQITSLITLFRGSSLQQLSTLSKINKFPAECWPVLNRYIMTAHLEKYIAEGVSGLFRVPALKSDIKMLEYVINQQKIPDHLLLKPACLAGFLKNRIREIGFFNVEDCNRLLTIESNGLDEGAKYTALNKLIKASLSTKSLEDRDWFLIAVKLFGEAYRSAPNEPSKEEQRVCKRDLVGLFAQHFFVHPEIDYSSYASGAAGASKMFEEFEAKKEEPIVMKRLLSIPDLQALASELNAS
ncbi:hypothetical protein [uncultured Endozoicomonas sp.]|uniref:hypothetical protein n=1 Tax=uncultured Endozoicomonas sp. TaxID=432652 RepID=UPI0026230B9C|nr:hypothetical protein [uncultured Endozoicomonas sp.]